jgi:rare lipoprotein A
MLCAAHVGCASTSNERAAAPVDGDAIINPVRTRAGNPPVYEVFGETYYVQDSSEDYRERGIASWYGEDFHGRPTANGEEYDMHALTAAHKTLPIPTWVEVTNLNNGRRVIVKVNDRGPFVGGRIIDLSYAAAETLGMVRAGTARVEVRALGVPIGSELPEQPVLAAAKPAESKATGFALIATAAAAEPDASARPMRQLFVQVGAFADRANAARLADRLTASGQANVFVVSATGGARELHRVRIGPLPDEAAFGALERQLATLGVRESHLVVVN